MNKPTPPTDYLREIGQKGGQSKSAKKREAVIKNAAKARAQKASKTK